MLRIFALIVFLAPPTACLAGIGFFTFNSYGPTTFNAGNWPGARVKNFITDIGATCNGVADDTSSLDSWRTGAVASNPQLNVLYIPPGSICNFATSENGQGNFPWNGTIGGAGVQNLVIWAYGAKCITACGFQSESYPQNTNGTARIQTVSAGATTLTLVNSGDASKFSNGNWVAVTGLTIQCEALPSSCDSFPPNFQWSEYVQITNISGSTITFTPALQFSYKSTWPAYANGDATHQDSGGPATIYLMPPSWGMTASLYGLTFVAPNSSYQFNMVGQNVSMYDVSIIGGTIGPSSFQNGYIRGLYISDPTNTNTIEIDKNIQNLTIVNSIVDAGGNMIFQSGSDNVTVTNFGGKISGTSRSMTITGNPNVISSLAIGPNCFGNGNALTIQGVTITTGQPIYCDVNASILTFTTGTFSIANTAGSINTTIKAFVPGNKYFFAYDPAFNSNIGSFCNTGTEFTVTDITQDGTNTYYATNIGSSLPSPTCGGHTYNAYSPFPAQTITQTNSGPWDFTQYAP